METFSQQPLTERVRQALQYSLNHARLGPPFCDAAAAQHIEGLCALIQDLATSLLVDPASPAVSDEDVASFVEDAAKIISGSPFPSGRSYAKARQIADAALESFAQPLPKHPDDSAVNTFAAAMKAKLAAKRAEGRGGWDDKSQCSQQYLSYLLRNHVAKGDPVDVGNFAMMLHQRGESILPAPAGGGEVAL